MRFENHLLEVLDSPATNQLGSDGKPTPHKLIIFRNSQKSNPFFKLVFIRFTYKFHTAAAIYAFATSLFSKSTLYLGKKNSKGLMLRKPKNTFFLFLFFLMGLELENTKHIYAVTKR